MKLRHRLLVGLLAIALVTTVFVAAGAYALIGSAVQKRYTERLRDEATLLAEWLREAPLYEASRRAAAGDPGDLQRQAGLWGRLLEARVTLIEGGGKVLADSRMGVEGVPLLDNHGQRPEVVEAREKGRGEAYRLSASTGEVYYYLAQRTKGAGPVAFVRLALPAGQVRHAQLSYLWSVVGLSLASLLLLAVLAYLGIRSLSRPIEALAAEAEGVREGRLDQPIPRQGRGEVEALARAVEGMRESLVSKVTKLERKQALFDSVLSGVREGVLVVDARSRIRLANQALRSLCSVSVDPKGKALTEVFRHPELIEMVETALGRGEESQRQIRSLGTHPCIFEVTVLPLIREEGAAPIGALALIFDITRLEALEATRQRFVADLSHELRTPITSIQAAAATLLEGGLEDPEAARRFSKTIHRQCERMGALVSDLSDLSQIETGAIVLEPEMVEVAPCVREILAGIEAKYRNLELDVVIDIPEGLELRVDRRRFEQILLNLLDNGMKFNRPHGSLAITAAVAEESTRLAVEDSGVGIAEENRERIFQRFFRADDSRNRERGGTGLGLAIVKHLMTLHGGTIAVESEVGQGSRFILTFPR